MKYQTQIREGLQDDICDAVLNADIRCYSRGAFDYVRLRWHKTDKDRPEPYALVLGLQDLAGRLGVELYNKKQGGKQ